MRRLIILAVAATLTLSACGATADDADALHPGSSSPSATSTAAGLPTPGATAGGVGVQGSDQPGGAGEVVGGSIDDQVVTTIKLDLYGGGLLNAAGEWVDSFSYNQDPSVAASRLESLLGITPTTTPRADDPGLIASYSFGGVSLVHVQSSTFMNRRFTFEVTAASVSGISIVGPNGWQVGSPAAPIEANYDSWQDAGVLWIYANLTPHDYANQIYLQANEPYTTITSFSFPDGA